MNQKLKDKELKNFFPKTTLLINFYQHNKKNYIFYIVNLRTEKIIDFLFKQNHPDFDELLDKRAHILFHKNLQCNNPNYLFKKRI